MIQENGMERRNEREEVWGGLNLLSNLHRTAEVVELMEGGD